MNKILPVTLLLLSVAAHASLDGLPKSYPIRGNSRPCCGFTYSSVTKLTGTFRFASPKTLGDHDFGQMIAKKSVPVPKGHRAEGFGQLYTCNAGYVDLAHLRDTADWSAMIYRALLEKIGSGTRVSIRKESSLDGYDLVLPKMSAEERAKITPAMLGEMATALTFDMALFHEIATSFTVAVSGPRIPLLGDKVINERSSSFSVEDAYSNLLGAHLGVQAALDSQPYNEAMTRILENRLNDFDMQPLAHGESVHASLKGTWWLGGPFHGYRKLRRRSFEYEDGLMPKIPRTKTAEKYCPNPQPMELGVPTVEKITGRPHQSTAYVRQVPNRPYRNHLKAIGVKLNDDGSFTRDQFPVAIEKIRQRMSRRIPHMQEFE